MNERTSDVIAVDLIAWGGFPHPDPVMRHAPVSVRLAPPLWRRVLHHLSVQDAAWAGWLGDTAVSSFRESLECELAHDAPTADRPMTIPALALEAIHSTLRSSFWQPLAIWIGSSDSTTDGYYRLILINGAIAVLRPSPADPSRLILEDLFFTRSHAKTQDGDALRRHAVLQTLDRYATFDPSRGQFKPRGTRHITHTHSIRFVVPRMWSEPPASDSPADPTKPSELAERIGFDRLFDSRSESSIPSLATETAVLAARDLQQQIQRWTDAARTLIASAEDATEAYQDELSLSLLENRISAWASFLAIDEAYANSLDSIDLNPGLATEIDAVMAAMESFDEALQAAEVFWSPFANRSELLKNCQAKLAGPHRLALPWFMSGNPSRAPARTAFYRLG